MGINNNDIHPSKIEFLLIKLSVFHFDKSGKVVNDEHSSNIQPKSVTFFVFHFDISGKDNKLEHL